MAKRRRKPRYPQGIFQADIESLAHDGRGVTHVEGKTVFIDGALPDERVDFVYTDSRRSFATGRVEQVIKASPLRGEPGCPHYGVCGGCSLQHVKESEQILLKQNLLKEQLQHIGKIEQSDFWPPMTGPRWNYRKKARLGVKFVMKKDRVLVGFRERGAGMVADLTQCPVLDEKVAQMLLPLGELFDRLSIKSKLPQVELAIGDDQCVLVLRVLEEPSDQDVALLTEFANAHLVRFQLQRGSPDQLTELNGDNVELLSYTIEQSNVRFNFLPTEFTQVNSAINQQMVARVLEVLKPTREDRVLDLFCGLGNFTLPLALKAGHVVGVEGSHQLVNRAKDNAALNGIVNAEFFMADLSKSLDGMPWLNQHYDKILLDPSRSGALELMHYIPRWNPRLLVYVSCNPSTLARDSGVLVNELGYRLVKAGVMDMFPHTSHVESIALFERS